MRIEDMGNFWNFSRRCAERLIGISIFKVDLPNLISEEMFTTIYL